MVPAEPASGWTASCVGWSSMDAFSVIASLLTVLGIWTATSLLATPVVVLCLRGQARVNARCTREVRRQSWAAASQG